MRQYGIEQSAPRIDSGAPAGAYGDSAQVFRNHAIDHYVDLSASKHPGKAALIDRFGSLTWSEVEGMSRRLANGLAASGVRPGDRVAVQLPNWRHFPLLEYALSRLGAVCVPLPIIYRERELRFMLNLVRPVLIVAPGTFRGFDHAAMFDELQPRLPGLGSIVTVGETLRPGHVPFDELLAHPPLAGPGRTDPDAISEIVFTSGTTGEPKGVMHSANSNLCPLFSLIDAQHLTSDETILMASTFGHQTGFVYGGQLPAVLGATLVLLDRWEGVAGARLIKEHQVTWTMGATPFLQDLVKCAASEDLPSLRTFLCSGAPIPPSLLSAARARDRRRHCHGMGHDRSRPRDADKARRHRRPGCSVRRQGARLHGNQNHRGRRQPGRPGRRRRVVMPRALDVPRLLPAARAHGRRIHRFELVPHGGSRQGRPDGLPAHHRTLQGHRHPGWRKHPGDRDRGPVAPAPPPSNEWPSWPFPIAD